jgi:hypothetical protein
VLKSLLAEPEKFADFTFLEKMSKMFQDMAAFTVYFGWIKVFKYISFNKTMSQLAGTITRCASDVGAFGIMFGIVFTAYAQVGFLMFGVHVSIDLCFVQEKFLLDYSLFFVCACQIYSLYAGRREYLRQEKRKNYYSTGVMYGMNVTDNT